MPVRWLCMSLTINIEILLADVTKPEKSKILSLTWPVTSLVTREAIKIGFASTVFQGFQMPLEFLESVQYFRGSGGTRNSPPPPVGRVIKMPQWGAG